MHSSWILKLDIDKTTARVARKKTEGELCLRSSEKLSESRGSDVGVDILGWRERGN